MKKANKAPQSGRKVIILKIGLALSCQKINKVPTDRFDKKMNYIFTESKVYK